MYSPKRIQEVKDYILKYKTQYSVEAIKKAVIESGYTTTEFDEALTSFTDLYQDDENEFFDKKINSLSERESRVRANNLIYNFPKIIFITLILIAILIFYPNFGVEDSKLKTLLLFGFWDIIVSSIFVAYGIHAVIQGRISLIAFISPQYITTGSSGSASGGLIAKILGLVLFVGGFYRYISIVYSMIFLLK
ncbi:MAG: hypothetical protein HGB12_10770 [Bacteroidetes bacterium]|nr:hypothetical protein [Bacteroidota bacterium]